VHVQIVNGTNVLAVGYRSTNPAVAAQAANAFANAYLDYRRNQTIAQYTLALQTIQAQIASTQHQINVLTTKLSKEEGKPKPDRTKEAALEAQQNQQIAKLALLNQQEETFSNITAIQTGGGQVLGAATVPGSPVSPNHVRTGAFAFVLVLALGLGLAFLRERLDDSIRT